AVTFTLSLHDALPISLFHEARVQALAKLNCTELDIGDKVSLIMGDVMIRFRAEGFYGDITYVKIWFREFKTHSFQVYYQLINKRSEEHTSELQSRENL